MLGCSDRRKSLRNQCVALDVLRLPVVPCVPRRRQGRHLTKNRLHTLPVEHERREAKHARSHCVFPLATSLRCGPRDGGGGNLGRAVKAALSLVCLTASQPARWLLAGYWSTSVGCLCGPGPIQCVFRHAQVKQAHCRGWLRPANLTPGNEPRRTGDRTTTAAACSLDLWLARLNAAILLRSSVLNECTSDRPVDWTGGQVEQAHARPIQSEIVWCPARAAGGCCCWWWLQLAPLVLLAALAAVQRIAGAHTPELPCAIALCSFEGKEAEQKRPDESERRESDRGGNEKAPTKRANERENSFDDAEQAKCARALAN